MEYANCQICYSMYNTQKQRPIILRCNHTICLKCHNSLPKSECPICNQIIAPEADLKTNIEVFELIKDYEELENLRPYVPPYIPPKEEFTYKNITEITKDRPTCPMHKGENLEWSSKSEKGRIKCRVCESYEIPDLGYWKCGHYYLAHFLCIKCKPPQNFCPEHPNIQLKWINKHKGNITFDYCRICQKKKGNREFVICKYGCLVCKSCNSSYFTDNRFSTTNTLHHVNGCSECITDVCLFSFMCVPLIGWGFLWYYLYGDPHICTHCNYHPSTNMDCKCSCLMRGSRSKHYNRIYYKCLHNNCSFHPDSPAIKNSHLACLKCQFKVEGGFALMEII